MSSVLYHENDKANVSALLQILAGLGILSAGAGLGWGSLKAFRKRMQEAQMPSVIQPSKALHNSLDSNRINISSEYFPDQDLEDSGEVKTAAALVQTYQEMIKRSSWEDPLNFNGLTEWGNSVGEWFSGLGGRLVNGFRDWTTGAYDHKVVPNVDGYKRLPTNATFQDKVEANLAQYPGLRALWFLPAATAVTGLGFMGGHKVADIIDGLIGKAQQRSFYNEKARKIYEESAKYLKDVAAGKVKIKEKKNKDSKDEKEQVKESAYTGDGTSGAAGFFFTPSFVLGLLGAGWLAKQMKGMCLGSEEAEQELADRTHMLWAALAAQKERNYNYNGLQIDVEEEPHVTSRDKKLHQQSQKLRDSVGDDNNKYQLAYENQNIGKLRDARKFIR